MNSSSKPVILIELVIFVLYVCTAKNNVQMTVHVQLTCNALFLSPLCSLPFSVSLIHPVLFVYVYLIVPILYSILFLCLFLSLWPFQLHFMGGGGAG